MISDMEFAKKTASARCYFLHIKFCQIKVFKILWRNQRWDRFDPWRGDLVPKIFGPGDASRHYSSANFHPNFPSPSALSAGGIWTHEVRISPIPPCPCLALILANVSFLVMRPYRLSSGSFNCPGDGFFPDPSSCTSFIRCVGGVVYKFQCPNGTEYNKKTSMCDFPDSAQCRI